MTRAHPPASLRRLVPAAVAVALLVGCSSDDGADADVVPASTTEAATQTTDEDGTTTEGEASTEDEATTEEAPATTGSAPTAEQLDGLLPEPADLGAGWSDAPTSADSDDPALDAAIEAQCPELARLQDEEDEADEVVGSYVNADSTELEVTLDDDAEAYSDEEFTAIIDAIGTCGEVTYTDDRGLTYLLNLSAQKEDGLGEQAARLTVDIHAEGSGLAQPIDLISNLIAFRRGPVGVSITGTDAVDGETQTVTPFDPALLDELAPMLDDDLADVLE